MTVFSSLKYQSLTWGFSVVNGAIATSLWAYSTIWERHRDCLLAGRFEVTISQLSGKDARLAEAGLFSKLPCMIISLNYPCWGQPLQICVAIAAAELQSQNWKNQ